MRFTFSKSLDRRYVLDIGYNTPFHASIYFISITKEFIDEHNNIEHASLIFKFWKGSQFK